jgi:hypothetical protein
VAAAGSPACSRRRRRFRVDAARHDGMCDATQPRGCWPERLPSCIDAPEDVDGFRSGRSPGATKPIWWPRLHSPLPADYLPAIDPIDAIESAPCMLQVRSGQDD